MTGWESAPVTSTLPLPEAAAAIEPDPNGWTDAMKGSDALVSDDVKSVSITGTERKPCAKQRYRNRANAMREKTLPPEEESLIRYFVAKRCCRQTAMTGRNDITFGGDGRSGVRGAELVSTKHGSRTDERI